MADGRLMSEWSIATSSMALLANCNRDPKKKRTPYVAWDFMPPDLRGKKPRRGGFPINAKTIGMLKDAFVK